MSVLVCGATGTCGRWMVGQGICGCWHSWILISILPHHPTPMYEASLDLTASHSGIKKSTPMYEASLDLTASCSGIKKYQ